MQNFPRTLKHGSGVMMTLDPHRLLLAFKSSKSQQDVDALLQQSRLGLILEDAEDKDVAGSARFSEIVNHTRQRFWIRTQDGSAIDQEKFNALQNAAGADLAWIGPVYQLPNMQARGGLLSPLPNVLLIRPFQILITSGGDEIQAILAKFGMHEVAEKSKYLDPYRYFVLDEPLKQTVYQVQPALLDQASELIQEARFENMPMLVPITAIPNDTFFSQQWDMTQIQGPNAWDISTGSSSVVACVLDTGCDLTHPDLQFSTQGINLGTMMPDGGPDGGGEEGHGTCCAGIIAARFNNALGVTGVAGSCQIMPVAFQNWTDTEVAAGINYAANNGARVISMSFGQYAAGDGIGPSGWDFTVIDPAIANAVNNKNCVLCAATGNENIGTFNRYPARNALVMACGASDRSDNRKSPTSPDGECWGANFAPGVSVVAPGVQIPSTDIQGTRGFNSNNGGAFSGPCVNYASSGDAAGNYFLEFNGTSSATPHVAGFAALVASQYPSLTNVQIRNIIERTASRVGSTPYADASGFPNGPRNQQMGYGRINLFQGIDFADVLIKDWPGDTGVEPSSPAGGDFWDFSDEVVRIFDDGVFAPDDPTRSSNVERGQTNFIYVRVTNNGPSTARNVVVDVRITAFVGLQFVISDWSAVDATHVQPTPITATFASIPAGGSAMAKFSVSSTQVESLWGWISGMHWHPCMLAKVTADNDYAFASANLTSSVIVVQRNNLAQRNLSVINVIGSASVLFPFIAGHIMNAEPSMDLMIDRSQLPKDMELLLSLDDDGQLFPLVDFTASGSVPDSPCDNGIVFLERTKLEMTVGCCRSVLTLEKGSRLDCLNPPRIGKISVEGGEVILRNGKRYVDVRDAVAIVRMEKQPGQIYPFSLQTTIPASAGSGQQFFVKVSQRDQKGEIVGGASVMYLA